MTGILEPFRRQQAFARERANAVPRDAYVVSTLHVQGTGVTRMEGDRAVPFHTLLLEEPRFSYGVVALSPVSDLLMPLCSALVTGYVTTDQGLYSAANIAAVVFIASSEGLTAEQAAKAAEIRVQFDLRFEGVAVRSTAGLTI
jgi:hypothetical protein